MLTINNIKMKKILKLVFLIFMLNPTFTAFTQTNQPNEQIAISLVATEELQDRLQELIQQFEEQNPDLDVQPRFRSHSDVAWDENLGNWDVREVFVAIEATPHVKDKVMDLNTFIALDDSFDVSDFYLDINLYRLLDYRV